MDRIIWPIYAKACHRSIRQCGLHRALCGHSASGRGLPNGALEQSSGPHWSPSNAPRADFGAKFVCFGVLVASEGRGGGEKGGGHGAPTCACTEYACTSLRPSAPPRNRPSQHNAPRIACNRQCQQLSVGEGAGRRQWRVRAWSRSCAYASTRNSPAMCCACTSNGVRAPFPPPYPRICKAQASDKSRTK